MKGDINTNLTKRELEILKLVAEGHIYKEIAKLLGVACSTVKNHMALIRDKLGAHTTTHAVVISKDKGLI